MSDKFNILRKLLKALGLSDERVEELIAWIETWLQDDCEEAANEKTLQPERYPYRLQGNLLSAAERRFFEALQPAVESWAFVCPKVRLGDIVYDYTAGNRKWTPAGNRINQKHVDFLLCDRHTMQPLLAIELNDRSHERADRRKRDKFVLNVFDTVGLPLVGVAPRTHYDVAELGRFLEARASVNQVAQPVTAGPAANNELVTAPDAPHCPKCGAEMVQRIAKSGANAGKAFWGCSRFPACRGMVA